MVFTLGFFSPLPLAMMIPFMATQSLAMGEAFGKSFQYGKRKISAMTNEEFNSYSMSTMMDEQTSNYRMIIPKLHEQMAASASMQQDIFREMINIIPEFFKALVEATKEFIPPPVTLGEYEGTITQATTTAPPTSLQLVSHGDTITQDPAPFQSAIKTWNQTSLRALSEQELQNGLYNNRWTGSTATLAQRVLAEKRQPATETIQPKDPTAAAYYTQYTKQLTALWNTWKKSQLIYLKSKKANSGRNKSGSGTRITQQHKDITNAHHKAILIFTRNRPKYNNVNEFRNYIKNDVHYTS